MTHRHSLSFAALLLSSFSILAADACGQESDVPIETLILRSREQLGTLRQSFDVLLEEARKTFAAKGSEDDPEPADRIQTKLGSWVRVFPEAVVDALAGSTSEAARRRFEAVLATTKDPRLLGPLRTLLTNPDLKIRRAATRLLGTIPDPQVVPLLTSILGAEVTAGERADALESLASVDPAESESRARPFLSSPDPQLRRAALRSLEMSKVDPKSTLKLLIEASQSDADVDVRVEALRLLRFHPGDFEAMKALHAAVGDADRKLVAAALDALTLVADKEISKRFLVTASQSAPDQELKERAAKVLLALGDPSGVRALLRQQREDADRQPRNDRLQYELGDEYRRLGAYADALDAYQRALNAIASQRQQPGIGLLVSVARCQARLQRFAETKKTLTRANYKSLSPFRNDPDFAEMRAHDKYRDLFDDN